MTTTNFAPTMDTYLYGGGQANTNEDTQGLTIGFAASKSSVDGQHTVIEFDVSSLGAATVTSAQLNLWCWAASAANNGATYVDRGRRTDVSETQATWNIYKTANNWGTAGANNTSSDIDTTNRVTGPAMPTSVPAGGQAYVITGLAALVQDAIDNYSGILRLILRGTAAESGGASKFIACRDSEYGTSAERPSLDVVAAEAGFAHTFAAVM